MLLTSLVKLEGQQETVRLRYWVPVLRLSPGSVTLTLLGGRGLLTVVMPKMVVEPRPSATEGPAVSLITVKIRLEFLLWRERRLRASTHCGKIMVSKPLPSMHAGLYVLQ